MIIQLIRGAVGGNIAGAVLQKLNLGVLSNSIAGIGGGGVGGAVVMAIAGLIKSQMSKS